MLRVAYGYLAMIDAEATTIVAEAGVTVSACRDSEELWPYWVTKMSTGWVLDVTDPKFVRRVRDVCGEDLYQGLLDLDLVGWRRRKVPYIGHFYADAGMVLRFVQTDVFQPDIPSELFAAAQPLAIRGIAYGIDATLERLGPGALVAPVNPASFLWLLVLRRRTHWPTYCDGVVVGEDAPEDRVFDRLANSCS